MSVRSVNYLRNINQSLRFFSLSGSLAKNHYISLGIAPTATQADIKEAYYKLSMLYHPDKSKNIDNDMVQKFRDITEAYEVLGNVRLRRLYDKGVSHISDGTVHKFYKSREKPSRPQSTGSTPIYDFDEWSRQHYGVLLAKERAFKERVTSHKQAVETEVETLQMGRVLLVMLFVFSALALFKGPDHDAIHIDNSRKSNSK